MKASICIATYNKPEALGNTLESIYRQHVPFLFETIVVDDGSETDKTRKVCEQFPLVSFQRIEREPTYRNPAKARNVAYRLAQGEVIVAQSDDVIHANLNTINNLVSELFPKHFVIATVINTDVGGNPTSDKSGNGYGDKLTTYTSPKRRRPLFFLGSLYRKDLYAIGGNDEDFVDPAGEDVWFAHCLINGLFLRPTYSATIVGHHQQHKHTTDYTGVNRSHALLRSKTKAASHNPTLWQAASGSWPLPPVSRFDRSGLANGGGGYRLKTLWNAPD